MDMFALMQRVKSRPGNRVDHFLILNDQSVLWSDLEPNDTRRVQQYFTELHFARDLLPNLAGMSMGGAGSPAARTKARDGFLTLPRNLSPRSSIEPLTLFLGKDEVPHHCIIYRVGGSGGGI